MTKALVRLLGEVVRRCHFPVTEAVPARICFTETWPVIAMRALRILHNICSKGLRLFLTADIG